MIDKSRNSNVFCPGKERCMWIGRGRDSETRSNVDIAMPTKAASKQIAQQTQYTVNAHSSTNSTYEKEQTKIPNHTEMMTAGKIATVKIEIYRTAIYII